MYILQLRSDEKQMTQRVSIISLNVLLLRPIEELYAGGPSICLETRGKISRLRSLKNSCAIWLVPWNINLPRLLWMNLRHQHHQNQKASPNHGLGIPDINREVRNPSTKPPSFGPSHRHLKPHWRTRRWVRSQRSAYILAMHVVEASSDFSEFGQGVKVSMSMVRAGHRENLTQPPGLICMVSATAFHQVLPFSWALITAFNSVLHKWMRAGKHSQNHGGTFIMWAVYIPIVSGFANARLIMPIFGHCSDSLQSILKPALRGTLTLGGGNSGDTVLSLKICLA